MMAITFVPLFDPLRTSQGDQWIFEAFAECRRAPDEIVSLKNLPNHFGFDITLFVVIEPVKFTFVHPTEVIFSYSDSFHNILTIATFYVALTRALSRCARPPEAKQPSHEVRSPNQVLTRTS
jgi:hypothetical protein